MVKRVTSASGRKWQRYNRWRSENRALDRKRRQARLREKGAAADLKFEMPDIKGPALRGKRANRFDNLRGKPFDKLRVKPLFVVTIRCRDGESVKLAVNEGMWGNLTPCATIVGRKVACVLREYRPAVGHKPRLTSCSC